MIGAKRRPSGSLLVLSFSSRGYLRSLLTFNHPDVGGVPLHHHGRGVADCALASVRRSHVLLPSFSFLLRPPRRRGVSRHHHGRGASSCVLASVRRSCVLLLSSSSLLQPPRCRGVPRHHHGRGASGCVLASVRRSACCCCPSPSSFDHPDVAASLVTTMGEALPVARSSVSSYVWLPSFSFLLDGPFSAMRCAPWSTRSQIASATVGSAR